MKMTKSNKGTVLAHDKGYRVSDGGDVVTPRGQRRKLFENGKGYLYFSIRDEHRRGYWVYVHKLQALQKFGPDMFRDDVEVRHLNGDSRDNRAYQKYGNAFLQPGIEVRHLNNNSADNSLDNIDIGTHQENMLDVPAELRRLRSRKGQRAGTAKVRKFTFEEVQEIRKLREEGWTYSQLRLRFPCAKSTMSYIINNKTYTSTLE